MDQLVAQKPLGFSLLSTSPEFFIDQKYFSLVFLYTVSQYLMTRDFTAVRQDVNNFDSSVVGQELEFAMNLALYGLL